MVTYINFSSRTIVSTCLERSKKMPLEAVTPLEDQYLHEMSTL
ncbi:hypothetical protein [Sporobacter termitidis]|nr:hypothetical protein [Sporobacter termitidis]